MTNDVNCNNALCEYSPANGCKKCGIPAIGSKEYYIDVIKQAQGILTRYLVPDGICGDDAIAELLQILDDENLVLAMKKELST